VITAVDTNIFLDILIPDSPYGDAAEESLTKCLEAGGVIISEAVYAELAAHFSTKNQLDHFLGETDIRLCPSSADALHLAGKAWRAYMRRRTNSAVCPACGTSQQFHCSECGSTFLPRQHVVADFIIGAHARIHADQLLTRDRWYYHTYFPDLRLIQNKK
jgi:predicted nucleic acid-binding protein